MSGTIDVLPLHAFKASTDSFTLTIKVKHHKKTAASDIFSAVPVKMVNLSLYRLGQTLRAPKS
jgi:hypothetical protein